MIQFWRDSDSCERTFIVFAVAALVVLVVGFSYLYQLAAHLDALDAARR